MRNSKIQIMLCVTILSLWAACGEPMPFDCATPIILGPILDQMRTIEELCGTAHLSKNWYDPNIWPSIPYVFEIMDCPLSVGKYKYDRIVQVKFDRALAHVCHLTEDKKQKKRDEFYLVDVLDSWDPLDSKEKASYRAMIISLEKEYSHIFRLFVKDGLVMKIEHMEPSDTVHVYNQTIKDKANAMHFDDAEYTKLSKESLLEVFTGECLWLRLPPGRHEAKIRLQPADDILSKKERIFCGIMEFPDKPLLVDFDFQDKEVRRLSITSRRGNGQSGGKNKDCITYFLMNQRKNEIGNGYFVTDAIFYDKWSNNDLRAHFDQNLGLRKYSKGPRGVLKDILQWEANGANRKCYTVTQQQIDLADPNKRIMTVTRIYLGDKVYTEYKNGTDF